MVQLLEKSTLGPLPPTTLTRFDDDSTQWESFYSQYTNMIVPRKISDHEKLLYLRNALKGAAYRTIEGIPVANDRLQETIDRLTTVFGQSNRTTTILIHQLLAIKPKSNTFEDQLECTQRMMNKVFQVKDKSAVDNFPLIHQVAGIIHSKHLEKMFKSQPTTMKEALSIIESDLLERIQIMNLKTTFSSSNRSDHPSHPRDRGDYPVKSRSETPKHRQPFQGPPCVYCNKHAFFICPNITSIADRKSILKEKKLCFKCLTSHPQFGQCDRKCQQRSKPHHKSLCDSFPMNQRPNQSTIQATLTTNHPFTGVARLFTATASLQNPITNRSSTKHVFLDSGAMVSVISRSLANELNLKPHSSLPMTISGVGGETTGGAVHDVVTVNVVTMKGLCPINAVVMDTVITRSMNLQPLSSEDYAVVQTYCGDVPHLNQSTTITPDVLIGIAPTQDILADSKTTTLPSGYKLVQSILGPIITGETHPNPSISHQYIHQENILTSLITDDPFEKQRIKRHLSIDEAGGSEYSTAEAETRIESNQKVEQHFHDTVEKIDDQYQVQYATKPEIDNLPTNYDLSFCRLKSTHHSLSKNTHHHELYDSIIKELLTAGMIEVANPNVPAAQQCHYLAHQAVLRADKPTTPLRIVYDASAKLKGKPCLNDVISQGPCTLEHLRRILIHSIHTVHVPSCQNKEPSYSSSTNQGILPAPRGTWEESSQ